MNTQALVKTLRLFTQYLQAAVAAWDVTIAVLPAWMEQPYADDWLLVIRSKYLAKSRLQLAFCRLIWQRTVTQCIVAVWLGSFLLAWDADVGRMLPTWLGMLGCIVNPMLWMVAIMNCYSDITMWQRRVVEDERDVAKERAAIAARQCRKMMDFL